MKKAFFSLMLLCGLALFSTSCNKDNGNNGNSNVTPEVQSGEMTVSTNTSDIITAKAVKYGQKNAIVLASKEMTAADNEGIAIIFNGNIVPGTYTKSGNSKDPVPTVVGFHEFNLGELPFIMGADSLFYGDTYYWMNGELAVVQNSDGTYHVVLSQCMGANENGQSIQLALNFTGPLGPYTFDANNKFKIKNTESPIGLAGLTQLNGLSSLGLDVKSMIFMSANRKRFYIVSYLGGQLVDGEYNLGYIGTPWVPRFPCVHVALDGDFWTFQPQTGYIAKEGTLKVVTNDDGTKTVTMENLKLKNVEHDSELIWPLLDGSLQYHGYMYELSL
ncbi:MAG: hypothetical protein IKO23_05605 [Bacteroidales bacterium]|nr:hypothetical protein [Bacteroidales bacterium]